MLKSFFPHTHTHTQCSDSNPSFGAAFASISILLFVIASIQLVSVCVFNPLPGRYMYMYNVCGELMSLQPLLKFSSCS